jgi:hypothetical protein
MRVAQKYGVKLLDLDQEESTLVHVFDQNDFRPHAVRMSKLLLDPGSFLISAAMPKTHDRVVTTLSLKNIIFGAPVKDLGFRWGKGAKPGTKTDKPIAHGGGTRLQLQPPRALAQRLHHAMASSTATPDGRQRLATDFAVRSPWGHCGHRWLAADRVAVELMGVDFAKVGYLNYCADARLGEADLSRIEILGDPIDRHIRQYKLAANIEEQLTWMKAKG